MIKWWMETSCLRGYNSKRISYFQARGGVVQWSDEAVQHRDI